MADTTKKIFFEVDGGNVESTFNRYKQLANESARAMIGSANQYAQTGREVNKYLEDEIRLREKKAKLEFEERRSDVTDRYRRDIRSAKTDDAREKVQKGYEGRMKEVAMDEREFQKQTNLLKSIHDTLIATAREEIRADRANVEKQVQAYKSGKLKGLSPEEEAKLKVQSEMIGGEGEQKQKGMFSPVFWGTVLGNLIPNALSKVGSMVKADSSERALNTMMRAIPFVGDVIADIRERAMDAEQTLQTEKYKFEARTGRGVSFADMGTPYGYTSADLFTIGEQSAKMRGRAGGNVNATINAVALEKAYGLSLQETMGLMRTERFGGGGAMNDIGVIIAALKNQGLWNEDSQVKIPEYLSMLVQLQEEQVKKGGTVDNSQNLANISAMVKLGDKYARDSTYITSISGAIAAPKNEFQQARSLATLANLNPNADLWELRMMQEKGLGQKGYMSGLVNMIKSRYGTGTKSNLNQGATAFYEMVKGQGISLADADRMYKESVKNPDLWQGVTNDESYRKMLDKMGIFTTETRALGKERVPELTKDQARAMEKFSQGAIIGTADLLQQAGQKAKDYISEGAQNIRDSIRESMVEFKQNLKESVKEAFEGLKFWKKNETVNE